MRRPFLLLILLLAATGLLSAQSTQPIVRVPHLPPIPRDGQGTSTAVTPILIYHSIRPYIDSDSPSVRRYIATPDTLEKELAYLKDNGYTSVTFDDLANRLTKGTALPAKPFIISFDDNWQSQYVYAVPLLKKYGFTATFYIWVVVVGMKNHMTWDEVREISAAGMQIGCHTWTHPFLTRVKDDQALKKEILGAKQRIEAEIGKPVTSIAYPFGQYDQRVVDAVKEAGFTSARSTWPGVVHSTEGLFSLTGLIRTESTASLVDAMAGYLAQATPSVDGAAGAILGLEPGDGTAPSPATP
ncbi:MAG: polysaccharide deacetylase family protein [Spirochaetia bacterium]|jgi:peptidoglycan/xylan/chitin deacetylase (PgdA/CDA1 family)